MCGTYRAPRDGVQVHEGFHQLRVVKYDLVRKCPRGGLLLRQEGAGLQSDSAGPRRGRGHYGDVPGGRLDARSTDEVCRARGDSELGHTPCPKYQRGDGGFLIGSSD
jgi:hypothetical protein